MGYSVLYIAFGIVALWLLGEVLLQYKARLRWRVLAFAGFMGVVGGVALREVIVVVLGAIMFGTGQTFVTLSYKRGFSTGWALGGRPGSSRRRKGGVPRAAADPTLEVTPVEPEYAPGVPGDGYYQGQDEFSGNLADSADRDMFQPVHQPVPLLDDSGEYPLYDGQSSYTPDPYTSGGYEGYGAQGYAGWDGDSRPAADYFGQPQPAPAAASYEGAYAGYEGGYQQPGGWGGDAAGDAGGQGYGYDPAAQHEQQPAAAYDPGGGYSAYSGYDAYGTQAGAGATGAAGDWAPQPNPQHQEPYRDSYQAPPPPQSPPDSYAPPGYDHEQPPQPYTPQQQYAAEPAEYADPYDPYRY
jgi:hypothetical protein